jgi:hypothetical protein
MNPAEKLSRVVKAPRLTRTRIVLALIVAAGADGLQLLFFQFGWVGPDQAIDLVAMVVISALIGFHLLLLPAFVIELIPVLDDLPTWIACTAAVIALRKREQLAPPPTPAPPEKPVIDV